MQRLSVLLADFSGDDVQLGALLDEWGRAGILGSVGWMDIGGRADAGVVHYATPDGVASREFFDLLTSKIWDSVAIIALRFSPLGAISPERATAEVKVLQSVRQSFSAHSGLTLSTFTVSMADETGLQPHAFDPLWDFHLLHEQIVRIDTSVAAQPVRDEHRAPLLALLAITSAGGFSWQSAQTVEGFSDSLQGNFKPIRIARAFLRVVNAGRLTDEVLAGAFPASGPWSVPPDVSVARAVPPGTAVPERVVTDLVDAAKFNYGRFIPPSREKATKLGMIEGLKLFAKEFVDALKSIPQEWVLAIKKEAQDWIQSRTFGEDSSISLRFDPNDVDIDFESLGEAVLALHLIEDVDAMGESRPWEVLQQVTLGLVDGGKFPEGIDIPRSASYRLIFTDPTSIGPAPGTPGFFVSPIEEDLLGLEAAEGRAIDVLDVPSIRAFDHRLNGVLADARTSVANSVDGSSDSLRDAGENAKVKSSKSDVRVGLDEKNTSSPSGKVEEKGRKAKGSESRRNTKKQKNKSGKRKKKTAARSLWGVLLRRKRAENPEDSEVSAPSEPESQDLSESQATESSTVSDVKAGLGDEDGTSHESTPIETEAKEEPVDGLASTRGRHRPSSPDFDPSEYVGLATSYLGDNINIASGYAANNSIYEAALKTYELADGYWKIRRGCDVCGRKLDHVVLYLHEPTQELVHVGRDCARQWLPSLDTDDHFLQKLEELDKRWKEWLGSQKESLLYRVGSRGFDGLVAAEQDLEKALEFLATRPRAMADQKLAREKFRKWTRRGLFVFVLLLAASIASVVFTPLPLLIFAGVLAIYGSGFITKIVLLARDLVRARFRLNQQATAFDRAFDVGRHAAMEIVRLINYFEQLADWQIILRELIHIPFGREIAFASGTSGIADITRPPAFVLGKSEPNNDQKMRLYLNARSQTIHAGWLTEIMDVLKAEWGHEYRNSRLTGPGDNILPEADNAPSGSIVGKRPLSDEDVFYPRTDFRHQLLKGRLQNKLVEQKAHQIAVELGRSSVDTLLGSVDVQGLGSALSGQSVQDFLAGLSRPPKASVGFDPEIFSSLYPEFRHSTPEVSLPPYGEQDESIYGSIHVAPGVEFTAAAWRVELSGPIAPIEAFKAYQPDQLTEAPIPTSEDEPIA
jgi:hypothetical protein